MLLLITHEFIVSSFAFTSTTYGLFSFPRYNALSNSLYTRLVQYLNASSPILVTLSGIVMLVRLSQPKNASLPILVTLSGIVMLVRLEQL